MSALAWLFGFGLFAAAVPFVFHLIRRTPKGEVAFSSLMFLKPTPPTLSRRSRLDNLLLMAMRIGAIALIALAFMRPFFDSNVKLDFTDVPGTKKAVLLDTSASMKRSGLWEKSLEKLQEIIAASETNDEIAVYRFDSQLNSLFDFAKKSEASNYQQKLRDQNIEPGWHRSDLGRALVDIANRLLESNSEKETQQSQGVNSKLQVFVISDMQNGSTTSALQNFQWPSQVKVQLVSVAEPSSTNATLELLPSDESDLDGERENVLVRNSSDSKLDQFWVEWEGSTRAPVPFIVPPGSSKILKVKRDQTSHDSKSLVLAGDDADFDNQFFALPPVMQTVRIQYYGNESSNDPEGMLFYFQRALIETTSTSYDLQILPADEENAASPASESPDLIVVARPVNQTERDSIEDMLRTGVTLLVALGDNSMIESTRKWTSIKDSENTPEQNKNNYAMLGAIDFSAPIFSPFAGPRFNDFTQVRFWKYIRPELTDHVQVLAHFDDDTPAIWHQISNDKSDIYTFGWGWQPANSHLALSSKFLPLVMRLIELADKTEPIVASNVVGDSTSIPDGYDQIVSPTGDVESLEDSKVMQFSLPGVHSIRSSTNPQLPALQVAVNIDPAESRTSLMPADQFSALGVELGVHETGEEEIERKRQLLDIELENRQKVWKWLVLGALGLIVGESWLAGRTDRYNRRHGNETQGANDE